MNLLGQDHDFRFPDSVFMRNMLSGIFQGREYPLPVLPGYTASTIVDVGANIGAAAIYFLNAFPTAEIWCYEPSLQNFWFLEANTRDFPTRIRVLPYGLLDRDSDLSMYHGIDQCGQNSLVNTLETFPEAAETVRLVRAGREASQRQWHHISILKIDTEGCEVPILAELLSAVPTIDFVFCEYHSEEDRRAINSLTADRFVLGSSYAERPHLGSCLFWSRDLLRSRPEFDGFRKSMPRNNA